MNELQHAAMAELLSAYIDGNVSPDERALLESHLAECPRCARDLETLRRTVAWVGSLPTMTVPRSFALRPEDVGSGRVPSVARRPWWQVLASPAWVGMVAALACVLFVGGFLLSRQTNPMQVSLAPAPATMPTGGRPVMEKAVAPAPGAAEMDDDLEADAAVGHARDSLVTTDLATAATQDEMAPVGHLADFSVAPETGAQRYGEEGSAPGAAPLPEENQAVVATEVEQRAETPGATATMTSSAAQESAAVVSDTPTAVPTGEAAEAMRVEEVASGETAAAKDLAAGEPADASGGGGALSAAAPAPVAGVPAMAVENLSLRIEPGTIVISGSLPLKAGAVLVGELWRDGQPLAWTTSQSPTVTVDKLGQFCLRLVAEPDAADYDLLAVTPATYEIRLLPLGGDPTTAALIPFDTYSPPAE